MMPEFIGTFARILKKPYRLGRLTRAQILKSLALVNLSNAALLAENGRLKRQLKRARARLRTAPKKRKGGRK